MKEFILYLSILLLFVLTGCNSSSLQNVEDKPELGKTSLYLTNEQKVEDYSLSKENNIRIDDSINYENQEAKDNNSNKDNITQIGNTLNSKNEELKKSILKMTIEELNAFSSQYENYIHCKCYFINYNEDTNIVVRISDDYNKIETVNIYSKTICSQDIISKIQYGMDIEEVVEMIGNPIGSFTFGINSLDFAIDQNTIIRIQVNEDLKVLHISKNINK